MKKQQTEMDAKLKALDYRVKRSEEILKKGDRAAVERHRESITTIVSTISILKGSIEEAKFAQSESVESIEQWGSEIDDQIAMADQCSGKLSDFVKEVDQKSKAFELKQTHEQTMQFEKQLLEQKLEAALKEKQIAEKTVRLPKLNITKFNGKPHDWVRFKGQFKAMVDSQNVSPITKFSHLKELVEPNIRNAIDCLPFTEEGYKRALKYLEEKYGHPSEVAGSYVVSLLELPTVNEREVLKIHRFYEQLLFNVESLETLDKLHSIEGATYYVMKKLEVIKSELVSHIEKDWRDWTFKDLLESLKKWTETNVVSAKNPKRNKLGKESPPGGRAFGSRDQELKCVYCESTEHRAKSCDKVLTPLERKKILAKKRLCFNCASGQHHANACKSKVSCHHCEGRHHTTICESKKPEEDQNGTSFAANQNKSSVIHPIVLIKINGQTFRALLDSGASHSYVSSTLIERVKACPVKISTRRIATLMSTTTTKVEEYDLTLEAMSQEFILNARCTKINKRELLTLDNPQYKRVLNHYQHLRGVTMDDMTDERKLSVHMIIGANEYAKIRTQTEVRVGKQGEPVAEFTHFGWALMAPGEDVDVKIGFIAVNSATDYDRLCTLDVLGLEDSPPGDQGEVYKEFREQLTRHPVEGWYETNLTWKGNHPSLPSNRSGSLTRMKTLVNKLKREGNLEAYDAIIREQLAEGVVERAPEQVVGRECYVPHRAVIREEAQSTKMRIVYDCSAKADRNSPSLNDCLDPGPPLQNKLWSVLVRGRFHPVCLTGDLRKAFLQVRIRDGDRDALRFHWLKSLDSNEVEILRFTRALFGLAPSPFLLGGVIDQHLIGWESRRPASVDEIRRSLYVDDLISGGTTVSQVKDLKQAAVEIFDDASFHLHKLHSNVPELETVEPDVQHDDAEPSFVEQQLNTVSNKKASILGLPWDCEKDELSVIFPGKVNENPTKRGILAKLAKIYDPLGLISPMTLEGKLLYRNACDSKFSWDNPICNPLLKEWLKWEESLPLQISFPRSLVSHRECIKAVELHSFGDASGCGVCAAVYAVVRQESGVSQGLVTAKSRLAKRGLTIPRLELVAGHMAVNLAQNVRDAIEGFPVIGVYCWLDSTVALHWICGNGEYRQFVANRVRKIQAHDIDSWRYVPTSQNPADLGSRGGSVVDAKLWWEGPRWLPYADSWPSNPVTSDTAESTAECKVVRSVMVTVEDKSDDVFDTLLEKRDLSTTLRVCAWISRFVHNAKRKPKIVGPLTAGELQLQKNWWIRREQARAKTNPKFVADCAQLNLQLNSTGILECRGRIQGAYPVYLSEIGRFAERLVAQAHLQTIHGGVLLTMTKIREEYWIPRLRSLTKRVIRKCYGCKRFQAIAHSNPPPGLLPTSRTEGTKVFESIGVDFAGPIRYRRKTKAESKAYLILYACCLTRALFLEILPSLETSELLRSLKRFIARRGRPKRIFSDNGKTFVAAAKWLKMVQRDERLNKFLSENSIAWTFNLSRAPWWGGQFERLIGVFKSSFFKSIGNGLLTWNELAEVVLDVEVALNNRPLNYLEDVQLPVLTPASFLFQGPLLLPEQDPAAVDDKDLRKREKYLRKCKDHLWSRWTSEYLRALRERHSMKNNGEELKLQVGDVVIIKSQEKNRGKWPLGIVVKLVNGKDGVVRAVKLRAGKDHLERPVQHLYPLELSCDRSEETPLNVEAPVFRPKRQAAVLANERIKKQVAAQDS